MKPRILLLITKADIGGAQIHLLELIRGLSDQYEFILAVGEEDFLSREARALQVEVHILSHLLRPLSLFEDVRGFVEILQLLKQLKPDLLHAHSSKAGVLGRLAAFSMSVPVLFTAHGWAFTEGAHPLRRIYGWGIEFLLGFLSQGIVMISDYDYQLARRFKVGIWRPKWLVKNCVAPSKAHLSIGMKKPNSVATIISIGRLSPVKNQLLLLDALALLKQPFRALIIGEGAQRSAIEQKRAQLGLQEQVALLGEVEECDPYLAQSDVFVLSSNYEGLPLSILEAMSAHLPVVATSVGGVSEAVVDGKTGYLVPRLDATALAEKMDALLADPELCASMGRFAYAKYQKEFTLNKLIAGMSGVYSALL